MLSSGLNVVRQAFGVVSGIVVARLVGPETLGTLAFASAFIGMFSPLSDFGFGIAHIKRLSEGCDLSQCMGTAWLSRILFVIVMAVTILVFGWGMGNRGFDTPELRMVFFLVLASLVVNQLSMVPVTTLAAFQDVFRKDVPPAVIQLLNGLLRVTIALLGFGAIGLAAVDLTTQVVLLGVYLWIVRSYPVALPGYRFFKGYAGFGLPMFLVGLMSNVGDKLDRVLLQSLSGTVSLGQYSAGMRLGDLFQYLSVSVGGLVFPSMSRAYAEGCPEDAFALCSRAERRLGLVLFPIVLAMSAVAQPLVLLLLGAQYADSGPVIAFGTMAMVFQSLAQPYRQVVAGANRIVLSVVGQGIQLAVLAGTVFIALSGPEPSVPGLTTAAPRAAAAVAIASLAGVVLWRGLAARFLGSPLEGGVWIQATSALLLFGTVYYLTFTTASQSLIMGIVMASGAVSVHLIMLRLTGQLGRSDLQFLRSLASVINLKSCGR